MVTQKFIQDVQYVLDQMVCNQIEVKQFVEVWQALENVEGKRTESELKQQKELALDFFLQFADSAKRPVIDIDRMRRLLPKQKYYSDKYIEKVQHVHVPWISKGLKQYQERAGATLIGGLAIPKALGMVGGPLDIQHIESVEFSVVELQKKFKEILQAAYIMKNQLSEQKNLSKFLKEVYS